MERVGAPSLDERLIAAADPPARTPPLAARFSDFLHDRGERGCAWHGAADELICMGFLLGASLQVLAFLTLAHPTPTEGVRLPVHPSLAMVAMFALLAAFPVFEELLLRGSLFAILRARQPTAVAGTLSVLASLVLHALLFGAAPSIVAGTAAAASLGMLSRLWLRALGVAIALNVGAATMVVGRLALD